MKFLCKIGFHKWLEIGIFSLVIPHGRVFECLRCHLRKAEYGYATVFVREPKTKWNDYLDLQLSGIVPGKPRSEEE